MLPGICPACGFRADLDGFLLPGEINRAIAAALELPAPLGRQLLPYLRLFAPKQKHLATSKLARLLTELHDAVMAGEVKRNGIVFTVPLETWQVALELILTTPPNTLPLTNHHYLYQIVANLCAKASGQAERLAEAQQKQSRRFDPSVGMQPIKTLVAPATDPPVSRSGPPAGWLQETLKKIATGETDDNDTS